MNRFGKGGRCGLGSRRRKEAEVWAIVLRSPPPHVGGYFVEKTVGRAHFPLSRRGFCGLVPSFGKPDPDANSRNNRGSPQGGEISWLYPGHYLLRAGQEHRGQQRGREF